LFYHDLKLILKSLNFLVHSKVVTPFQALGCRQIKVKLETRSLIREILNSKTRIGFRRCYAPKPILPPTQRRKAMPGWV